jgi:3-oxoacyl-[acyl-carrier-protein] synthase III
MDNPMINIAPYAQQTLSQRSEEQIKAALAASPLGEDFAATENEVQSWLAHELAFVWQEFDARISAVPLIQKLEQGHFTLDDYKTLLINLRQQVAEGGRWLSRAASSMETPLFPIRSALIGHAHDEHRDYLMLEQMYCNVGGQLEDIQSRPRNVGSDALTAYMFHESTKTNPLQLFGAMFLIEGIGNNKAGLWGNLIKDQLDLRDEDIIFMSYHAEHDDEHFDKLRFVLSLPEITQPVAQSIVKTAKVVGRLYCLQLEELDNY